MAGDYFLSSSVEMPSPQGCRRKWGPNRGSRVFPSYSQCQAGERRDPPAPPDLQGHIFLSRRTPEPSSYMLGLEPGTPAACEPTIWGINLAPRGNYSPALPSAVECSSRAPAGTCFPALPVGGRHSGDPPPQSTLVEVFGPLLKSQLPTQDTRYCSSLDMGAAVPQTTES